MLVVELTPAVVTRAQALLQRHPLRAGDAVQLASCLELRTELEEPITLVVFDDRLAAAARKEKVRLEYVGLPAPVRVSEALHCGGYVWRGQHGSVLGSRRVASHLASGVAC